MHAKDFSERMILSGSSRSEMGGIFFYMAETENRARQTVLKSSHLKAFFLSLYVCLNCIDAAGSTVKADHSGKTCRSGRST